MRSSFFHLRQSSISEDGQEKWRLAAAALPYLECLIPKRQGRGNRVATSHRLQISSATRRHGVGGMMTGTRRARSVTQEKRGQGERRAFLQHGKPLRTVGWQFQLDGIVQVRLGVHGCSVMRIIILGGCGGCWRTRVFLHGICMGPFRTYSSVLHIAVRRLCKMQPYRPAARLKAATEHSIEHSSSGK
jgi:hypothetical protein